MNLEHLRTLLALIEHGSFQAAALARREPRTRLRRQIQDLEAEVGLPLIHRGARGVTLTAAGEHLGHRAVALLRDAEAMLAEARQGERGVWGTLRLVVPVGMPTAPRVTALQTLAALHPALTLDVVEADEPLSLLHKPFDYLVHFGDRPQLAQSFSRLLMQLPVALMASPDYLARAGTPSRVEDLARHRLLSWRPDPRFAERWPRLRGAAIPVAPVLISANARLVIRAAAAGGGLALVPRAVEVFEPGVSLVPVLASDLGGELAVRLLSHHASRSEPRLRAVFENIDRMIESVAPDLERGETSSPTDAPAR